MATKLIMGRESRSLRRSLIRSLPVQPRHNPSLMPCPCSSPVRQPEAPRVRRRDDHATCARRRSGRSGHSPATRASPCRAAQLRQRSKTPSLPSRSSLLRAAALRVGAPDAQRCAKGAHAQRISPLALPSCPRRGCPLSHAPLRRCVLRRGAPTAQNCRGPRRQRLAATDDAHPDRASERCLDLLERASLLIY